MSVITPTSPPQTQQAVVTGVGNFMEASDPLRDLLRKTADGLQVFSVGLKSVASGGAGIRDAKPVGWRFMVAGPSGEAVAAHVHEQLTDAPPKMTSLSRGEKIAKAIRIAKELNTLTQTKDQAYEARVLRIPGIPIEAFWLKPGSGDGLVVPFLSLTQGLEQEHVYKMNDFLAKIQPLADKQLEYGTSSQTQD